MAMTPAQRKAKLEAAKALMNEVEIDETSTSTTTVTPSGTNTPTASKLMASFFPHKSGAPDKQPAASVAPATAPTTTVPTAAAAVRTPYSDAIAAGKPSLFNTLTSVAKLGFGKTQKG